MNRVLNSITRIKSFKRKRKAAIIVRKEIGMERNRRRKSAIPKSRDMLNLR